MKRIAILILLLSAASACSSDQTPRKNNLEKAVENELNEGARSFGAKSFVESQQHFERAVDLDPFNKKAAILLARVIHSQYQRGETPPENIARANDAISAYKRALALDPTNDEAVRNIITLLESLDRTNEAREWVQISADNQAISPERRSELYAVLASKDWECSIDVTDKNKLTVQRPDGLVSFQYKKPKDAEQYDTALKCMTHGLEMAETAIKMNPDSEVAWTQKYLLLMEAGKLAKMDGNESKAAEYQKQATEARVQNTMLYEKARQAKTIPTPISSETDLDTLVPPVLEHLSLIAPIEEEPTTPAEKQPK